MFWDLPRVSAWLPSSTRRSVQTVGGVRTTVQVTDAVHACMDRLGVITKPIMTIYVLWGRYPLQLLFETILKNTTGLSVAPEQIVGYELIYFWFIFSHTRIHHKHTPQQHLRTNTELYLSKHYIDKDIAKHYAGYNVYLNILFFWTLFISEHYV